MDEIHNALVSETFDSLRELIKIMTYDTSKGGMREAGLKQLDFIRKEFSKIKRENCGLNQTNLNLKRRVDSKFSSGEPWSRRANIERMK